MISNVNIVVPKPYRHTMRRLYLTWTIKNLRPSLRTKRLTHEEMFEFFNKRYEVQNFASTPVMDGLLDWYLKPLEYCEAHFSFIPNNKDILALDLGCGAASVGHWLRKNYYNWSYFGVDIAQTAEHYFKKVKNSSFLAKNVSELRCVDLPKKPDIIFAVNLLCYIPDVENYLKELMEISHEKTQLIIIEAYPGKFWAKTMPSQTYPTQEVIRMLSASGWRTEKTINLGLFNILNKPFWTISHSFVCSRS